MRARLRERGFKVEMYHEEKSLKTQMKYASRKGIAYVWFPANAEQIAHEVKDMTADEQTLAELGSRKP